MWWISPTVVELHPSYLHKHEINTSSSYIKPCVTAAVLWPSRDKYTGGMTKYDNENINVDYLMILYFLCNDEYPVTMLKFCFN